MMFLEEKEALFPQNSVHFPIFQTKKSKWLIDNTTIKILDKLLLFHSSISAQESPSLKNKKMWQLPNLNNPPKRGKSLSGTHKLQHLNHIYQKMIDILQHITLLALIDPIRQPIATGWKEQQKQDRCINQARRRAFFGVHKLQTIVAD